VIRPAAREGPLECIPGALFRTRLRNPSLGGDNPCERKDLTSDDISGGGRIVLFAPPGAFTPARSGMRRPGHERLRDAVLAHGVERVVRLVVNDAFALFRFARSRTVE
jgi:peroxiredoxin